jgi:hypothetical protein
MDAWTVHRPADRHCFAELSWTERSTNPHRRHRIEIDATWVRCLVHCEHGWHQLGAATRASVDEDFAAGAVPAIFVEALAELVQMERASRAPKPAVVEPEPVEDVEEIDDDAPWNAEGWEESLKRGAADMKARGATEEDQYLKLEDLTPEELADFERCIAASMAADAERKRVANLPFCIVCGAARSARNEAGEVATLRA